MRPPPRRHALHSCPLPIVLRFLLNHGRIPVPLSCPSPCYLPPSPRRQPTPTAYQIISTSWAGTTYTSIHLSHPRFALTHKPHLSVRPGRFERQTKGQKEGRERRGCIGGGKEKKKGKEKEELPSSFPFRLSPGNSTIVHLLLCFAGLSEITNTYGQNPITVPSEPDLHQAPPPRLILALRPV